MLTQNLEKVNQSSSNLNTGT